MVLLGFGAAGALRSKGFEYLALSIYAIPNY